jgi:hypothetical protein
MINLLTIKKRSLDIHDLGRAKQRWLMPNIKDQRQRPRTANNNGMAVQGGNTALLPNCQGFLR